MVRTKPFSMPNLFDAVAIAITSPVTLTLMGVTWAVLSAYQIARSNLCRKEIRPTDYRPIFIDERLGQHGESIKVFKFQSMHDGDEDSFDRCDRTLPLRDRTIPYISKILRKTHADELPQLVNVLTGQMALNGGMRPKTTGEWLLAAGLPSVELSEIMRKIRSGEIAGSLITIMERPEMANKLDKTWADKIARILSVRPSLMGPSQVAKGIDKTPGNVAATRQMINFQIAYMDDMASLPIWPKIRKNAGIYASTILRIARGEGDHVAPVIPKGAEMAFH